MAEENTQVQENKTDLISQSNLPTPPEFNVGDTVRVSYKITEGGKTRAQPYEGIVISKKGSGVSKTFMVRRISSDGVGVERIFPLYSPNIEEVKVLKAGKVRRAKIYYLRKAKGRSATRIKEAIKKEEAPKN